MNQNRDTQLLVLIIIIGYLVNFILGFVGACFETNSYLQILLWQIGDTGGITASILASRYVGSKGFHLSAASFNMLGIVYGISFGSFSFTQLNADKMATLLIPMIPAALLVSLCKLFPLWTRVLAVLICIPFFIMYVNIISGSYESTNWINYVSFSGIQLLGIIWSFYIYKDYRASYKTEPEA